MRVLVTGGAGLVGSHTAEYYAKKGDEVIVLDNLMRSQLFGYDKKSVEYTWNYLAKYKNIERIKGDVRDEKDILKAIGDGVDVVIHTAGQPGGPSVRPYSQGGLQHQCLWNIKYIGMPEAKISKSHLYLLLN